MDEISVVILDRSVFINERQDKTLPLVELWDEIYFIRAFRGNTMELTIQQVHSYYDLVKNGEAPNLYFPAIDNSVGGSFIIPRLDENDKVYFYDVISKTKIYPGLDVTEKIQMYVAKIKQT